MEGKIKRERIESVLIFCIAISLLSCVNPENNKQFIKGVEPTESSLSDTSFNDLVGRRYNVALLLIDGTYNTELTAPMDIFHHTKFREGVKAMNVFTVSNTNDLVTTFEGLRILPDFNYLDTVPTIDILVIPAGEHNLGNDLEDTALIDFIRETGKKADFVCSHCDGAFLLAKSGLLDDRISTTFPSDIKEFRVMFPELEVAEDVVLVHDDKFITSAGGAQSFEASLYLAEILYGKKVTNELAQGMVIEWDIDSIKYLRVEN
ncbi:MAG: glutamine amidotransferase [Flavobacteriales bacterium]|nr:glutamine amidotransferase [Flavobacteriales bacterium]